MSIGKVALLGLGTVGCGVVKSLGINEARWKEHFGSKVEIAGILVRDRFKKRKVDVDPDIITTDFEQILLVDDLSVVIEVIGGIEPARSYIIQAIEKGCHVVTANKELMAKHGDELLSWAEQKGVHLLYEASVAGGIPILGTLRNQLQFNQIDRISGILNGTTNYILSQMTSHGRSYEEVLKEAQQLGYAELDPTSDVDGHDALYKLIILARCTLGISVKPNQVSCEGIRSVRIEEIALAEALGFRLKLVAAMESQGTDVLLEVSPRLIHKGHALYDVNDVFNAVHVSGNIVGDLAFIGKGAGEFPTASAVLEDLWFITENPRRKGRLVNPTQSELNVRRFDNSGPQLLHFSVQRGEGEWAMDVFKDRLQLQGAVIHEKKWIPIGDRDWIGLIASGATSNAWNDIGWDVASRHLLEDVYLKKEKYSQKAEVV
jgi:homoserine dehydrogenase